MNKRIIQSILAAFSTFGVVCGANAMAPMTDLEMEKVIGQGIIVSETILGSGPAAGFKYYRMGLDARLSLNANIDKMQLGCGGFNESIASNSCEIDLDFVRLMGLDAGGTQAGAVGSDFVLTRPYIELATTGSGTTREVVGLKIGSQQADGFFGVGRRYANGEVNLENGGTCGSGNPTSREACHSGINRLSGNIRSELSGQFPVSITLLGTQNACFGDSANNADCNTPYFIDIVGTRINEIYQESVPLTLDEGFLNAIGIDEAYATIQQSLRFIHGFALDGTDDFFLSFQRQKLVYPTYDKTSYSATANAGWWMNVPSVNVKNFTGDTVSLGIGEALEALGAPGPVVEDSELNVNPPDNCFGTATFC